MLAIGSVVFAIVAAVGGSTVYDNVKPFGFQDPNSDSARAYDALRDATGERPIPEVELLVAPTSGRPLPDAQRAALELRSVDGIQRVITPADDPALVSTDGQMALVLGFISSDVDDISADRHRRQGPVFGRSRDRGRRSRGNRRRAHHDHRRTT